MKKLCRGLLLIMMLLGHNYVLNQPQALEAQLEQTHDITVPEFNLLYSLPSAFSIILILPFGMLYDQHSLSILLFAAVIMVVGQTIVMLYGPDGNSDNAFQMFIGGRVLESTGSEALYMIQGNLASTSMGKLAGMIFILPECGEIANVFLTPLIATHFSVPAAFRVGFVVTVFSFIVCILLWYHLKQNSHQQLKSEEQGEKNHSNTIQSCQKITLQPNEQQNEEQNIKQSDEGKAANTEIEVKRTKQKKVKEFKKQATSILEASRMFWLMILLCAINECLYFPFLDNANAFVSKCYGIDYTQTGFFLSLPFLFAILMTAVFGFVLLSRYERRVLVFLSTLLPLMGHFVIFLSTNCERESSLLLEKVLLVMGLMFFGMGLGAYYSVCFPAVGLTVPQQIRGTGYACLCFFQTISMTIIPLISGQIIEEGRHKRGFKGSSFFFVCLCLLGSAVGYFIMTTANKTSFDHDEDTQDEQQELFV